MKMSVIVFYITLSLGLLICGSESQSMMRSRTFMRFANGLPISTVSFLVQHQCEPVLSQKQENQAVSQWTYVTLNCKGLEQNHISAVQCKKMCLDPVSCKKMRWLKGVPVLQSQQINVSDSNVRTVELPVACKCVPGMMMKRTCTSSSPM